MRKKFLSVLLSAAMVTTLMAGCSNNAGNDNTGTFTGNYGGDNQR